MVSRRILLSLAVLLPLATSQTIGNGKRGLVYVPSAEHPEDDRYWTQAGSDLTWYYNYQAEPSAALASTDLQFVPMLWGASDNDQGTPFLDSVRRQIQGGANITWVLGLNEPDGTFNGGSGVPADLAAATWIRQIEPLREQGVLLGAPAVTSAPTGFVWLRNFFTECAGRCNPDFLPVHYYGNFEGLASHMGQVNGTYPNMTMWVTEFANAGVGLQEAQVFYNQSTEYMDRLPYVTHYSYFGSFRSDVSNVGPNAAMIDQDGELTNIGSWYLGGSATGNVPEGGSGGNSGNSATSSAGAAVKVLSDAARALLVTAAAFCALL